MNRKREDRQQVKEKAKPKTSNPPKRIKSNNIKITNNRLRLNQKLTNNHRII
jgi:hypothetical protein